jgi:ubiquinone/menaquinone biosynthesis C-methylase UbiE
VVAALAGTARAQSAAESFTPKVGQPGKDVVWVPTPQIIVDKMLDLARVTPEDFVVDLGSGDGRNIITAAKRGARGLGVEYNPDMVALSQRNAATEGVADRARFVQGDMFEADFSDATVLALFLLPDNLAKLRDKFLALRPGTRIVANTFWIEGWRPDETEELSEPDCFDWCNVLLFVVPSRVEGTWRFAGGELALTQSYQMISGTLTENGRPAPIASGRMTGDRIAFTAGGAEYSGRVIGERGDRIEGTINRAGQTQPWVASRPAAQEAAQAQETFEPVVGQPGKDVVWVPTPEVLVEKMLDMANVTPQDVVVDLGSGDGRNVIAAARRGARARGVEYNPNMVELSRRRAAEAGVSERATFVEGDMFEAEFADASVLALFLLPDNMRRLEEKFLDLRPGTRIVGNTFGFDEWQPDQREVITEGCQSWCTALLWIVPAKAGGTWRLPDGTLTLQQNYQKVSGTLRLNDRDMPIENGQLSGDQITFTAGGAQYTGRVSGASMKGTFKSGSESGAWSATRAN